MMRALLLASLAAVAACTSTTTTQTSATGEAPVVAAGECKVPGYDCSAADAPCADKCYATDTRADAYVRFVVDGRALDSRDVPLVLADPGANTLRYGCGLFTASDGTQGLELLYRKNGAGSAYQDDTTLRIDDFHGLGTYSALVRYTPSDVDQLAGKIYAKKGGCTVDVTAGEQGGLKATVACPSVPCADGSTVSITGEAACGGTALEPIVSALP
jgi:hypothetical protein